MVAQVRTANYFLFLMFACGCAQPALGISEDLASGFGAGDLAGIDLAGVDLTKVDLAGVTTCMPGYKFCGTNCIQESSCCQPSDCLQYPNSTAACIMYTCSYACNPGYRTCNGMCRMGNVCCVDSDCTPAPNSTGTKCNPQGQCTFSGCAPGYYDINGKSDDGCECHDGGQGQACAMATNVASVALGKSTMISGNLPGAMITNWLSVTFAGVGSVSYHPHIKLTDNPGNQFAFDVLNDCNTPVACGEAGKTGSGVTDWEVSAQLTDAKSPMSTMWQPVPAVGTSSVVKVNVYRVMGNATCENYTLTISN
jgi:hypothetical protein